jgi:hypothetical protein
LLFGGELERLGYSQNPAEEQYFQKILIASGGVPLAIKWAGQIAAERHSLSSAANVLDLRGAFKDSENGHMPAPAGWHHAIIGGIIQESRAALSHSSRPSTTE